MTQAPGRLYLVGVGPGDPELLTLKAARILRSVHVIAYPSTGDGASFPPSATLCHKCNTKALVIMDGCATCLNCGYSKCG